MSAAQSRLHSHISADYVVAAAVSYLPWLQYNRSDDWMSLHNAAMYEMLVATDFPIIIICNNMNSDMEAGKSTECCFCLFR